MTDPTPFNAESIGELLRRNESWLLTTIRQMKIDTQEQMAIAARLLQAANELGAAADELGADPLFGNWRNTQ